ncbi:extracellular solute-binding protein [Brevundimonas sp.]|uniref:extracellular solute-binding protein n=1 Tax=Brevundimonas sp. TaxID=1871086 RepID=UPI0025C13C24|nr:extracellular solute-binding protein [Brevundimonas sp.]
MRAVISIAAAVALTACGPREDVTEIQVQRVFGECGAEIGDRTDAENLDSECGVMTALINAFEAQNPDVRVRVNIAPWPGYDQLSARLASGDPPDLVTMHVSSIPDYQSRGLLAPLADGLAQAGVDRMTLTPTALGGVSRDGELYGLPIDIWAPLWHINMNLFRQAGLVRADGSPVLPTSADELLDQARRFTEATGKPYLVQSMANERAAYTRNLYTLLMQQNADFFADRRRIDLTTPEARRAVQLFKDIYDRNLTTRNQDYSAATAGFINGGGGVYLVGTWMIGDFEREANRPGAPLEGGYAVVPYPQLYPGRPASFIDGHAWVMPVRDRTSREREAVFRLLRFFAEHHLDWSRTGHLPTSQAVIESPEYLALPHRASIASLAEIGEPLPSDVERQFAIQDIIGDEMASAITGRKSIDRALADAEHRVNDLLFHIPETSNSRP